MKKKIKKKNKRAWEEKNCYKKEKKKVTRS